MAVTGDTAGERYAALFSQHSPRLYRTALGILGNRHDAADALQDAGLKAYQYFHTLHCEESAGPWLTRILIGACYDVGRRRGRTVPVGLDPAVGPDSPADVSGSPESGWELVGLLQRLPEEQRTTVVLRFWSDLSLGQIAEATGVPEGTVKSRLHAALGKLRAMMNEFGREEGVR